MEGPAFHDPVGSHPVTATSLARAQGDPLPDFPQQAHGIGKGVGEQGTAEEKTNR